MNRRDSIRQNAINTLIDSKRSIASVAREFAIPRTTLSTWVNKANALTKNEETLDLEQRLCDVIQHDENNSQRMTTSQIIQKAKLIANELNLKKIAASVTWVKRFRKEHAQLFKKQHACAICKTNENLMIKGYRCGHCFCCESCLMTYMQQVDRSENKVFRCLVCNRPDIEVLSQSSM